jgi:hypothetical protein
MVGLSPANRHRLVSEIVEPISDLKARPGRPHWIIVDEAHQVFPAANSASFKLPDVFPASIFVAVSPENLAGEILKKVDAVIAFGTGASDKLGHLRNALGFPGRLQDVGLHDDEALVWFRDRDGAAVPVNVDSPRQFHRRHTGKYAVGDVGEWHSFYFRGPRNKTNVRARNVCEFVDISRRLDDETWEHHLRTHDYSAWFRHVIKDEELAREVEKVERNPNLNPHESRADIARMVLARYAAPGS